MLQFLPELKQRDVVKERAEKLRPQPSSLSSHFPITVLEAKSSVLQRAGPGEGLQSHPAAGTMAYSLPPMQLCVVGPPPDMRGGCFMAPPASHPGWHVATANYGGLARHRPRGIFASLDLFQPGFACTQH